MLLGVRKAFFRRRGTLCSYNPLAGQHTSTSTFNQFSTHILSCFSFCTWIIKRHHGCISNIPHITTKSLLPLQSGKKLNTYDFYRIVIYKNILSLTNRRVGVGKQGYSSPSSDLPYDINIMIPYSGSCPDHTSNSTSIAANKFKNPRCLMCNVREKLRPNSHFKREKEG